jgi:Zn-dependent M28 family amino/carboxypeptidase
VAFVVLGLGALASWKALEARDRSPFDGARAYADLEYLVGLGPRVSGTAAAEETRGYIRRELEGAGLKVEEQAFEADTPLGKRPMVNVVGIVEGTEPGVIVLGNHYDTKYLPEIRFVGANDGGSTTAWMLEMGRALGPRRTGLTVWLCFFDGEEAFVEWTEADSLYGSRAFVSRLQERGELSQVRAMVNVDMIGDCRLEVLGDPGAPGWLQEAIRSQAERLGYGAHFPRTARTVLDDHVPFRRAGVAAINLIDFEYGQSPVEHRNTWHTARDTIEKVCPDSLQAVGDVIYHALPVIDGLSGRAPAPAG